MAAGAGCRRAGGRAAAHGEREVGRGPALAGSRETCDADSARVPARGAKDGAHHRRWPVDGEVDSFRRAGGRARPHPRRRPGGAAGTRGGK